MGAFMLVGGILAGAVALVVNVSDSQTTAAKKASDDLQTAMASLSKPCVLGHATPEMENDPEARRVIKFDILGMRLYQPAGQAVAALNATGLFKHLPEVDTAPCASDMIEADRAERKAGDGVPVTPHQSCLARLTFEEGSDQVILKFAENFPAQPGCAVVTYISLEEASGGNSASLDAFEKLAAKKYGKPTFNGTWESLDDGPTMLDTSDINSDDISINDTSFETAVQDAVETAVEDDRQVTKPQL